MPPLLNQAGSWKGGFLENSSAGHAAGHLTPSAGSGRWHIPRFPEGHLVTHPSECVKPCPDSTLPARVSVIIWVFPVPPLRLARCPFDLCPQQCLFIKPSWPRTARILGDCKLPLRQPLRRWPRRQTCFPLGLLLRIGPGPSTWPGSWQLHPSFARGLKEQSQRPLLAPAGQTLS